MTHILTAALSCGSMLTLCSSYLCFNVLEGHVAAGDCCAWLAPDLFSNSCLLSVLNSYLAENPDAASAADLCVTCSE